jgi:fructokinase
MRLGIDLGGTKIEIVALDNAGQVLDKTRTDTPKHSYEAIVKTIKELVTATESRLGLSGTVGLGIPGTISKETGLVKNANTVVLIGHPLDKDLAKALDRPVRIANDANCFTLSEAHDGAAQGSAVTFGVILGTGCGGGIVVNNSIITGANSIGGEWGHNRLADMNDDERPGPDCYCGHKGCNETFLSGPGLANDHARVTGVRLETREIYQRAVMNDPSCRATLDRYIERLAKCLAVVINILDPDTIVLGGGLSNMDELYHKVPQKWGRYIFSDHVNTRLVKALHGDSSGVRGAAWLWPL